MTLDEAVKKISDEANSAEQESFTIHEAIKAYRDANDYRVATLEEIDRQTLAVKVLMVP